MFFILVINIGKSQANYGNLEECCTSSLMSKPFIYFNFVGKIKFIKYLYNYKDCKILYIDNDK